MTDLGVASIELIELADTADDFLAEYGVSSVPDDELEDLRTIRDAIDMILRLAQDTGLQVVTNHATPSPAS